MDLIHTFDLATTNERLYMAYLLQKGAEALRMPVADGESVPGAVTADKQASDFYDVVQALNAISEKKAKRRRLTGY